MKKERVDVLLYERGLVMTREQGKRAVMAGLVYQNEERINKPGEKISIDENLQIKGEPMPYVSRGGFKLEKALNTFDIDLKDKILLDIGASTGGFTDCALQNGVKLVYALDVGTNQLAWKIRSDKRVVTMEKTNFRYVTHELFTKGTPQIATIDVSFISLTLILPVLKTILSCFGDCICLIKPQFEAGKEEVGKNGIINNPKIHKAVVEKIKNHATSDGFRFVDVIESPIKGVKGNTEFLAHLILEDRT